MLAPGAITSEVMEGLPMPASAYLVALPSLRYWRYQLALSQTEVAQRAGTSQRSIARLERGGCCHVPLVRALTAALVDEKASWAVDADERRERVDLTQPLSAEQRAYLARQI